MLRGCFKAQRTESDAVIISGLSCATPGSHAGEFFQYIGALIGVESPRRFAFL